jgi:hypothetical protein
MASARTRRAVSITRSRFSNSRAKRRVDRIRLVGEQHVERFTIGLAEPRST